METITVLGTNLIIYIAIGYKEHQEIFFETIFLEIQNYAKQNSTA